MYSRFITSQAVKILVCPVDQQRHRQAERQLPPALPPVAARNLSGNNPIDFKTFLFSGPLIQGSAWRLGRSLNLRRAMLTSLHRRPRGKKSLQRYCVVLTMKWIFWTKINGRRELLKNSLDCSIRWEEALLALVCVTHFTIGHWCSIYSICP